MKINRIAIGVFFTTFCYSLPQVAIAGITVGGTRVIYIGDQKVETLKVSNSDDGGVYLIRSWVGNVDQSKTIPPFVITPPLFRLDPSQENTIRISQTNTSALPKDRESLYWLNVMAIPPAVEKKNALQFTLNTRIKLIYRPVGLNNKKAVDESYKQLTFNKNTNEIDIFNPTPYYVSLFDLKFDGVTVKDKNLTIPPKGHSEVKGVKAGNVAQWSSINDNGGITPVMRKKVNFS